MSEEVLFALSPGVMLNEYKIERVLGSGGFGITYLAEDVNLRKKVAIKEYFPTEIATRDGKDSIRPKSEKHEEMFVAGVERFINEAKAVAQFNHPNIVRILRFFAARGTAYFVMDFYQGETLDEYLESNKKSMAASALKKIFPPIMRGLQVVHKAGMIHRDIKPGNIYLRKDGEPLLLDFGAARYAMGKASKNLSMVLTPGFAPFEQYRTEGKSQGPWTDIYSLAATMYRCITGETPKEAPDRAHAVLEGSDDPYQAASHKSLPAAMLAAIDRGLAFRYKDRPASIKEFAKDLGYSLTGAARTSTKSSEEAAWEEYGNFFEFAITGGDINAGQRKALDEKAQALGISTDDVIKIENHLARKNGLSYCTGCGKLFRGDSTTCDNCKAQPAQSAQPVASAPPPIKEPAASPVKATNEGSKYTGTVKAVWWLFGMFALHYFVAVGQPIPYISLIMAISGYVLFRKGKKNAAPAELAIYWWGINFSLISFSLELLLRFIGDFPTGPLGLILLVNTLSLLVMIISYRKIKAITAAALRNDQTKAVETSVYWFGFTSLFTMLYIHTFSSYSVYYTGYYDQFYLLFRDSKISAIAIVFIISTIFIYKRRTQIKQSGIAKSLYWLGLSLFISSFLQQLVYFEGLNLLLVAVYSIVAYWFVSKKPERTTSEILIYCLSILLVFVASGVFVRLLYTSTLFDLMIDPSSFY